MGEQSHWNVCNVKHVCCNKKNYKWILYGISYTEQTVFYGEVVFFMLSI